MSKKIIELIAGILVLAGAVNWGLVGAFDFNFVALAGATVAKIVYIAVGISAIVLLALKLMKGKMMKKK